LAGTASSLGWFARTAGSLLREISLMVKNMITELLLMGFTFFFSLSL
jgi:hypothetical protein